jgi:hypothetical protein
MTAPSPRSPWSPSVTPNGSRTPEELEAVNRRVADAMLVDELAATV